MQTQPVINTLQPAAAAAAAGIQETGLAPKAIEPAAVKEEAVTVNLQQHRKGGTSSQQLRKVTNHPLGKGPEYDELKLFILQAVTQALEQLAPLQQQHQQQQQQQEQQQQQNQQWQQQGLRSALQEQPHQVDKAALVHAIQKQLHQIRAAAAAAGLVKVANSSSSSSSNSSGPSSSSSNTNSSSSSSSVNHHSTMEAVPRNLAGESSNAITDQPYIKILGVPLLTSDPAVLFEQLVSPCKSCVSGTSDDIIARVVLAVVAVRSACSKLLPPHRAGALLLPDSFQHALSWKLKNWEAAGADARAARGGGAAAAAEHRARVLAVMAALRDYVGEVHWQQQQQQQQLDRCYQAGEQQQQQQHRYTEHNTRHHQQRQPEMVQQQEQQQQQQQQGMSSIFIDQQAAAAAAPALIKQPLDVLSHGIRCNLFRAVKAAFVTTPLPPPPPPAASPAAYPASPAAIVSSHQSGTAPASQPLSGATSATSATGDIFATTAATASADAPSAAELLSLLQLYNDLSPSKAIPGTEAQIAAQLAAVLPDPERGDLEGVIGGLAFLAELNQKFNRHLRPLEGWCRGAVMRWVKYII
jgi:hypothetical protein